LVNRDSGASIALTLRSHCSRFSSLIDLQRTTREEMVESHDILIVGAGTAGTYFGWQMAKRGHSVVIVERDQRDKVRYPFHVMRLPLFLQRLFNLAEAAGVRFRFSTEFTEMWECGMGSGRNCQPLFHLPSVKLLKAYPPFFPLARLLLNNPQLWHDP